MPIDYKKSKAHELRKRVVHASDDELVVLLGDLALQPGRKTTYSLEFPKALKSEPTFDTRFISKGKFDDFIEKCRDGELAVPPDFPSYPAPEVVTTKKIQKRPLTDDRPGMWRARYRDILGIDTEIDKPIEITQVRMEFKTEPEEGAYVFLINTEKSVPDASGTFSVVVVNKQRTSFPQSEDDDLTGILGPTVNLSVKNGLIWFVHPIFFVEQLTNTILSNKVKQEIVNCEGLPKDLPASDDVLVKLIWGYSFRGLKKIRLDVDKEEEVCIETGPVQVTEKGFEFSEIIRKVT
jgi:hypothetical protein